MINLLPEIHFQTTRSGGKGGQNVRLATQLTGWELNVIDASKASLNSEAELQKTMQMFVDQLAVDEDVAAILAEVGFNSVEEIAYVPVSEMLEIEGFDEDLVGDGGLREARLPNRRHLAGRLQGQAPRRPVAPRPDGQP